MHRLLLILLSLSFSLSAANPPVESFDRMDAAFPDIEFVNPAGEESSLSDYKGKVLLVKLWATWCGVCRAKWPGHQALYDNIKNEPGGAVDYAFRAQRSESEPGLGENPGLRCPVVRKPDPGPRRRPGGRRFLLFHQGYPDDFSNR